VGEKIINLRKDEQYITLQSLLQVGGVISTGGMAKIFLLENEVLVNGEKEDRRGRKLYSGDKVQVLKQSFLVK
jgi:ribosome-associated protein